MSAVAKATSRGADCVAEQGAVMKRLALLVAALALLAMHGAAAAQVKRVGVLGNEPWGPIEGLRDGLHQLGYVEGKTLLIDYRWSLGRPDMLATLAAELVNTRPDVIVTVGTPAVLAAKKATTTIPIVMGLIGDPVGAGIVTNIARPGGNITGVAVLAAELEPKRLEMLKEESIADLFRAEFTARNPSLVGIQILEFRSVSKKRGSDLVYVVRAIRADSKFEGKFEDEQFGVFIVDANRSKISKTLDMFNTPRWNDYELKIQSATRSKVVVRGRGATYGDQPFTKTYELIGK